MATVAELVTDVMAKVTTIQSLKKELAILIEDVRRGQAELAEDGVLMDFPVLREGMTKPAEVTPAISPTEMTAYVLASPITPIQLPPPTAEELAAEENLAKEEDLSRPLPGADTRPASSIRVDSLTQDSPVDLPSMASKMEKAILRGYQESGEKGSRFMV